VLVCNVCGRNGKAHHDVLRELVGSEKPLVVCIQETKLSVISPFDIMQCLGSCFDYFFLPIDGTRGGVLLAWHTNVWFASSTSARDFSISAKLAPVARGEKWWITMVYGPASEELKPNFLAELHDLRQVRDRPWLLMEHFNMIYRS
jgi:hypothetical protein